MPAVSVGNDLGLHESRELRADLPDKLVLDAKVARPSLGAFRSDQMAGGIERGRIGEPVECRPRQEGGCGFRRHAEVARAHDLGLAHGDAGTELAQVFRESESQDCRLERGQPVSS